MQLLILVPEELQERVGLSAQLSRRVSRSITVHLDGSLAVAKLCEKNSGVLRADDAWVLRSTERGRTSVRRSDGDGEVEERRKT